MWEISSKFQFFSFIGALTLGGILSLFYDIFRALRKVKNFTYINIFLQDIFCFLIFAFTTFIYLLSVTNGEIRGYVLIGIALGFIMMYYTVSKYFLVILIWLFNALKKIIKLFSSWFYRILEKIDVFLVKSTKNFFYYFKKGLKKLRSLLYNKTKLKN